MKRITFLSCLLVPLFGLTQSSGFISRVWVADNGNGTYRNPVIHADYSDPDAIRVGDDYYMTSSSFNHVPGLPLLHSKDLVNWKLIGYALKRQIPLEHFSKVQHGNGVWAPSIRFYKNEYYIYYPDPDFGIYLVKAKNIRGPWSDPVLVEEGKGLIDPCPLWDDDGKVYLVHAFAGSRAGIKSILVVKRLNTEGTRVIDDGVMVYDGHEMDPTIEGPKLYKRNGWYYIFAPAGGVSTGWQTVLRSRNIYGPYERRVVMDQGSTTINGPHQGAWVDTKNGEHWFIHFQDKEAYGRVVHLQPLKWINDWPVIGRDNDGDGKGEPVLSHKKPSATTTGVVSTVPDSDEFNEQALGLQWQWQANPKSTWAFPFHGKLRLFSVQLPDSTRNFWDVPNLLMQKIPAEECMVTAKLTFSPRLEGEKAGLIVHGANYGYISLARKGGGMQLAYTQCNKADKNSEEDVTLSDIIPGNIIYLRVTIEKPAVCQFSFSTDGESFKPLGEKLTAAPGRWVGAKMGLFCTRISKSNDAGFVDVDYFRVERIR